MRTVNKAIIIGNITRDPVVKTTEKGKKVALFTIATNRHYKTGEGEDRSESEFHNCVAWGNLGERCEQFLVKGKLVYAEGRLKTRVIDKDDGTRINKTEIIVSNLIFLNKREDFGNPSPSAPATPPLSDDSPGLESADIDVDEDDKF